MLNTHVSELSKLTAQKKLVEAEITDLKAKILDEMKAQDVDKYDTPLGTVSHVIRKSYEYSDAVKDAQEAVSILKVEEEEKGLAQVKTSEFVQFRGHD